MTPPRLRAPRLGRSLILEVWWSLGGHAVSDWAHMGMYVAYALEPQMQWVTVGRDGSSLGSATVKNLTESIERAMRGDQDQTWVTLKSVDEKGRVGCSFTLRFLTPRVGPTPGSHKRWEHVVGTITLYVGRDDDREALRETVGKVCEVAVPVWAELRGTTELLWPHPAPSMFTLNTGGTLDGIPQVGWFTYLARDQFPPSPVELEYGIVHQLPMGSLIELTAHPWTVDNDETMVAHASLRKELLAHRVIRPAADAVRDLGAEWKEHGVTPESLIPTDPGWRYLRPIPDEPDDDDDDGSLDDEGSFDESINDSFDEDSFDDSSDEDGPATPKRAPKAVPNIPLEDLDGTQALDVAQFQASPARALPFKGGTGQAPERVSTSPRIDLAPNPLDATTDVDVNQMMRGIQSLPATARRLPFSVDDYARLVARTEAGGPAAVGDTRQASHAEVGIGDEIARAEVDAIFDAHFHENLDAFDEYRKLLDRWRVYLRANRPR